MTEQYFWVENDHMQSFVYVLPQNDNVYFEALPLPSDEDSNYHVDVGNKSVYLWNVYITPENGVGDGHWIHLAMYKNAHKIVFADSAAYDADDWGVYKEMMRNILCEINWVQGGTRTVFFNCSNGRIRKKTGT